MKIQIVEITTKVKIQFKEVFAGVKRLKAIKTSVAPGMQLHKLSKEIARFFDAIDFAKKAHDQKKNFIFVTPNEEAMATWTRAQNAKTAEAELLEFIVGTKDFLTIRPSDTPQRDFTKP